MAPCPSFHRPLPGRALFLSFPRPFLNLESRNALVSKLVALSSNLDWISLLNRDSISHGRTTHTRRHVQLRERAHTHSVSLSFVGSPLSTQATSKVLLMDTRHINSTRGVRRRGMGRRGGREALGTQARLRLKAIFSLVRFLRSPELTTWG